MTSVDTEMSCLQIETLSNDSKQKVYSSIRSMGHIFPYIITKCIIIMSNSANMSEKFSHSTISERNYILDKINILSIKDGSLP